MGQKLSIVPGKRLLKIQTQESFYVVYQPSRHSQTWQESFHSSFSSSGESGVQVRWTQSSLPILFMDTIMRRVCVCVCVCVCARARARELMKTSFTMKQSVSSSSVSLLFYVACITYVFTSLFLAYLTPCITYVFTSLFLAYLTRPHSYKHFKAIAYCLYRPHVLKALWDANTLKEQTVWIQL